MGLRARLFPAGCIVALLGCGGNVVVDGASSRGATGSTSGSPGTMSGGVGGAGAGGSTATFGPVGGAGVGTGVGGDTGAGVTSSSPSSASASSTASSSSSSAGGGGPTGSLWDILGNFGPPAGAFVAPPFIAVDPAGNAYFTTGYVSGPLTFATELPCNKKLNVMVAKVSPAGQLLWSRCVSHTPVGDSLANANFSVSGITLTSAGVLVILGRFSGAIDFGTGPLTTASDLHDAAFLAALDASSGAGIWGKQFDAATEDQQAQLDWGLASDPAGDLYIGGGDLVAPLDLGGGVTLSPTAGQSAFAAKLDASGVGLWATEIAYVPGDYFPPVATVAVSPDGAHCVLGTAFSGTAVFGDGTPSGSGNPLVVELDASTGAIEWGLFPLGPSNQGSVSSLAFAGDDALIVGGAFGNQLDLGGGPLGLQSGSFVAKLDPTGALSWQLAMIPQGPDGYGSSTLDSVAADANGNVRYAATSLVPQLVTLGTETLSCPPGGPGFTCAFVGEIDPSGHPGAVQVVTALSFMGSGSNTRGNTVAFGSGEMLLAGVFPKWIDFGSGHVPQPETSASVFLAALP